ncbi:hypothetical protein EMCRGX_G018660 [Ephydatia muelleri]
MYHEAILAMRRIGRDCIEKRIKAVDYLLSEVEGVLGDRNEVTGDDLDKMKYTEQVIQEVLRLYPIGLPSLSKDSPKGGIVMSGYHIPEGTTIQGFSLGTLHHARVPRLAGLILKYWRQHKNTGVILTYLRTVHHVVVGCVSGRHGEVCEHQC